MRYAFANSTLPIHKLLNYYSLIDVVGQDESHPLASLMEVSDRILLGLMVVVKGVNEAGVKNC